MCLEKIWKQQSGTMRNRLEEILTFRSEALCFCAAPAACPIMALAALNSVGGNKSKKTLGRFCLPAVDRLFAEQEGYCKQVIHGAGY